MYSYTTSESGKVLKSNSTSKGKVCLHPRFNSLKVCIGDGTIITQKKEYSTSLNGIPTVYTKDVEIKQYISGSGYYIIKVRINSKWVIFYVHDIVLEVSKGKKPEGWVANHKNGNKLDNRPENLEYVTYSSNLTHAYDNGLRKDATPVDAFAIDMGFIGRFRSINAASKHFGVNRYQIDKCLKSGNSIDGLTFKRVGS